ncbi:ctd small phosphatase-like protein [Anaeramoeba ignava]|uniref:Ctd small phosphatase-like protein n=1 Tax=Anaeramoeba ignava TaxID=1746090 RepID=A0A9Q0RBD6_ANAIG|nr:ctd small phosphatase-like protein [Anaeramoeba ignava]|eukprot:Anaeramoba_ignava/a974_9.p1 GENE.a974_9~~a974_9.p1  ORF type:complete len:298 (-),score=100.32 a974_9:166-1059(-)
MELFSRSLKKRNVFLSEKKLKETDQNQQIEIKKPEENEKQTNSIQKKFSIISFIFSFCLKSQTKSKSKTKSKPESEPKKDEKSFLAIESETETESSNDEVDKYEYNFYCTKQPLFNLLGEKSDLDFTKKTLVLDLDETLVHSSFDEIKSCDYQFDVCIENQDYTIFVQKRPGVDKFLSKVTKIFEVVIFTSSDSIYADEVIDYLDKKKRIKKRLYRESCIQHRGYLVKDLSTLGRKIDEIIIIDNTPSSYLFQSANSIPITTWIDDPNDSELLKLIPFMEKLAVTKDPVQKSLKQFQ